MEWQTWRIYSWRHSCIVRATDGTVCLTVMPSFSDIVDVSIIGHSLNAVASLPYFTSHSTETTLLIWLLNLYENWRSLVGVESTTFRTARIDCDKHQRLCRNGHRDLQLSIKTNLCRFQHHTKHLIKLSLLTILRSKGSSSQIQHLIISNEHAERTLGKHQQIGLN